MKDVLALTSNNLDSALLEVSSFDTDKELKIWISEGGHYIAVWLTPNQTNELLSYLKESLKEINELDYRLT